MRQADVTGVQTCAPASSGADQFDFSTTGQSAYKLDTDGDNSDGAKGSETFSYSTFGDKVINESNLPAGWDLTGISCPNEIGRATCRDRSYHTSVTAGDT